MPAEPLTSDYLYTPCDLAEHAFTTTRELESVPGLVGQERALEALRFGTRIKRKGYNLFVLGAAGAGKHSAVIGYLQNEAKKQKPPSDWVYVNNFETSHKPTALELPSGQAHKLKSALEAVLDDLKVAVPAILESDEYKTRRQAVEGDYANRQNSAFETLSKRAEAAGIALLRTPGGLVLAPAENGEVLKPEDFNKRPKEERERIEQVIAELQKELGAIIEQIPAWEKEKHQRLSELNRAIAVSAVGRAMRATKSDFAHIRKVADWLANVEEDLVGHIGFFAGADMDESMRQPLFGTGGEDEAAPMRRYEVNIIVDGTHPDNGGGAPVVYADHPTFANVVGRVEHISRMGALLTDFTLIKPGALHKANGGYLILDAVKLLREPFAWDALKRALRSQQIVTESAGDYLSLVSTVSLEPDPIPLDVKIVLVGDRQIYYLLCAHDPDFGELFKVPADFDDVLDRETENEFLFARLIATIAKKEELLPFGKDAVARLIERGVRHAGDAEKISLIIAPIADLMREADFLAVEAGAEAVSARHVDAAVEAQIARTDRLREQSLEAITRDILLIETEGEKTGQVNGLSVVALGQSSFGRPGRITARVRTGGAGARVIDIERKVELGGPLHSKGVLILSGYLAGAFLLDEPMSLSASLVFEQSYGGVDGDSASSAELYALLSALSGVPIKQSFAVTGSVNQMGEVQAIGGVNEKIEGFFDVCVRRGLTGDQGVLIPAANIKHLMLRADVVDACERGMFSVYAVERIEEGVELLMGRPAGERDGEGHFPSDSVFALAEETLKRFAASARPIPPTKHGKNAKGIKL
ncbi:Lon protease family protein [Tepidicaulis sp. LMO-SS28]|uniref:Lon protease family protein n=1 Tax=Tepidicaulis sp. LMO-SS28 TaxID=3447455 RepID=UPI003EE372C6